MHIMYVFIFPYLTSSHSASYQHASSHLILSQSKLASSKVSFLGSMQGYTNPRLEVARGTKFVAVGSGEVSGLANIALPYKWRGRKKLPSYTKEQRKLSKLLSEINSSVLYNFYSAFAKVAAIPCRLKCVCVCVCERERERRHCG